MSHNIKATIEPHNQQRFTTPEAECVSEMITVLADRLSHGRAWEDGWVSVAVPRTVDFVPIRLTFIADLWQSRVQVKARLIGFSDQLRIGNHVADRAEYQVEWETV